MESHGKTINVLGMNKQKKKESKVEKITNKSENQLIPVKKNNKH